MQNFTDMKILDTIIELKEACEDRTYESDETYSSLFDEAMMELEHAEDAVFAAIEYKQNPSDYDKDYDEDED